LNIEEGGNLHLRGWNQIAYDQAGFMNFGKFSCSGTFNIDSLELAAIVNARIFIIDAFGSTILTNNAGGLLNNGVVDNQETFLSSGSEYFGISNDGTFTNDGSILIQDYQEAGIHKFPSFSNSNSVVLANGTEGIISNDSLYNPAGGHIEIANMSGESYNDAFRIGRIAINKGKISIDCINGHGLRVIGTFLNHDSIRITNAIKGIVNEGTIANHTGARRNVTHSDWGLVNTGIVENRAPLTIDTSFIRGFENCGQAQNFDTISLSTAGEYGLYNCDGLINNAGGLIQITGEAGIDDYALCNTAQILNFGKIDIKDFSGRGILNQNIVAKASIINYDTIVVQTVRTTGILNYVSLHNRESGVILVKNLTLEEYSELFPLITGLLLIMAGS